MNEHTPAQLYALGFRQYERMIEEGMEVETVQYLADGLGQDMYAVGARTALELRKERLAR